MSALAAFYAAHSKLIDQIGINALLALALSVSLQAGQLALAQVAFFGIAAYVAAILGMQLHWALFPCIVAGIAAGALTAALLALPVGRLRGIFLAIATIGFGEIVLVVANNLDITGGAEGLSGIPNDANTLWIYGALLLVAAILFFARTTRFALAMKLAREDESAARGVGVDVASVRLWTLTAGGAIAGLAGALFAHSSFFITPGDFGFSRMEQVLVFCVIGGATSPIGAVVGAALLSILPEAIRFLADYREVTNGVILLAVIIFAPQGIAGVWKRAR